MDDGCRHAAAFADWTQSRRAIASSAGNPCKIFGSYTRSCRCTSTASSAPVPPPSTSTSFAAAARCATAAASPPPQLPYQQSLLSRRSQPIQPPPPPPPPRQPIRCLVNRRLCHLSHFHSSRQRCGHRTPRCDSSCSLVLRLCSWVVDHLDVVAAAAVSDGERRMAGAAALTGRSNPPSSSAASAAMFRYDRAAAIRPGANQDVGLPQDGHGARYQFEISATAVRHHPRLAADWPRQDPHRVGGDVQLPALVLDGAMLLPRTNETTRSSVVSSVRDHRSPPSPSSRET